MHRYFSVSNSDRCISLSEAIICGQIISPGVPLSERFFKEQREISAKVTQPQ